MQSLSSVLLYLATTAFVIAGEAGQISPPSANPNTRLEQPRVAKVRFEPFPYHDLLDVHFTYNLSADLRPGDYKSPLEPAQFRYTSPLLAEKAIVSVRFSIILPDWDKTVFSVDICPEDLKGKPKEYSAPKIAASVFIPSHRNTREYLDWKDAIRSSAEKHLRAFVATVSVVETP